MDRDEAIRLSVVSFCSQECVQAARSEQFQKSKAKGPAIKATTAPRKRKRTSRSKFPEGLKDQVHAADGYRCRFCGERKFNLHAHHVIYRSQGGPDEFDNLLTLCDECHVKIHSNKKRYQPLALRILQLRATHNDTTTTLKGLDNG